MVTDGYSTVDLRKTLIYKGSIISDTGFVPQFSVWEFRYESKNSIDTDVFIPGQFMIHPYSVSRTVLSGGDGTAKYTKPFPPYQYIYDWRGKLGLVGIDKNRFHLPVLGDFPSESGRALQKAYSKVGQSQLSLGIELGELRETLAMLRSPLKGLRDFFLKKDKQGMSNIDLLYMLSRSSKRSKQLAIQSGKTLADTWLEFRYGIQPLVGSITAIAKEADRKKKAFLAKTILRARSGIKISTDKRTRYVSGGGTGFYPVQDIMQNSEVKIRATVYYRRLVEAGTLQNLGLSLEYLPEIAWELTRLSFVVDWIFSIGPWIGSFRFKPGIEILGNTVSMKATTRGLVATPEIYYDSTRKYYPFEEVSVAPVEYENNSYERVCNRDLPSTPFFRYADAVSFLHTVDSLALILQPLLKKLRH